AASGCMARGGARRTAALGLVLRLLLGFGLGLEAAPTPVPIPFLAHSPGIKPCARDGQCLPPTGSPCPCDSIDDCPDGLDHTVHNCSRQPCPAELRCLWGGACIPRTWLCDGHPDCPASSDELGCGTEMPQEGNATAMGTPVAPGTVTDLGNATTTSFGDQDSVQSGNRSACGVIAAAVVLSAGLAAISLFVLSRLWARGRLNQLGLLMVVKESLLLSERKSSLL
uniref:CD320 molecule n=1 Tax=Felis catus TaxID=9685 RepID=A0ABI8ASF7_FELCA